MARKGHTNNPNGAPSKLTGDLLDKICIDIAQGVPITKAYRANGIAVSTGYKWREEKPEVASELDKADAMWEAKALKFLFNSGDERAVATLLKMRCAEYRDSAKTEVNVNATAMASAQAVPQEKLERIRELRRNAMSAPSGGGLLN